MRDFIPYNDAEFLIWLNNFRNVFAAHAHNLNVPPEDINALDSKISSYSNSVQDVANQKEMMAKSVAEKNNWRKEIEKEVRAQANRLKTHKNFTDALGQHFGIIGSKSSFDPTTYKPNPKGKFTGGLVRISFQKKGVDGMNVYSRRKGEVEWKFRARDNNSPYEERIVLENPAVPEHWEYRLIGVIKDVEIGQPSDVIEVIVGA